MWFDNLKLWDRSVKINWASTKKARSGFKTLVLWWWALQPAEGQGCGSSSTSECHSVPAILAALYRRCQGEGKTKATCGGKTMEVARETWLLESEWTQKMKYRHKCCYASFPEDANSNLKSCCFIVFVCSGNSANSNVMKSCQQSLYSSVVYFFCCKHGSLESRARGLWLKSQSRKGWKRPLRS